MRILALPRGPAAAAVVLAAVACTRAAPAPATPSVATSPTAEATPPVPTPAPANSAPTPAPTPTADSMSASTTPAVPAAATPPLAGTRWVLVRVGAQRVITATGDPRRVPHLVFDAAAGRVAGSGGCNRLAGPYRQQGDTLALGPMVGTRMACPDAMATENALTAALPRVRGWRVVDGRLELLDAAGAAGQVVAAFTPAPADPR